MSEQRLLARLGRDPGSVFQCKPVMRLINEYELILISQGTAKGLLSRIYNILLNLIKVEGKARRYQKIGLGSSISDGDRCQISKKGILDLT